MFDLSYYLSGTPSTASWVVLAFAIVVVGGGLVGIRQSFERPRENVAGAYGVAGLFAILLLFAVGQGAYAVDMMLANSTEMSLPVAERSEFMAEAYAQARASLFFAGLGAMVATPMAIFLFLRFMYLRRNRALPEGTVGADHPVETSS